MKRLIGLVLLMVFIQAGVAMGGRISREDLEQEGHLEGVWPASGMVRISGTTYAIAGDLAEQLAQAPIGGQVYFAAREGRILGILVRDEEGRGKHGGRHGEAHR